MASISKNPGIIFADSCRVETQNTKHKTQTNEKTNEWTYSPKFTTARLAKDLAYTEHNLVEAIVDLMRLQASSGIDPKDVVFDTFIQMVDDARLAKETADDEDKDLWACTFRMGAFDWFVSEIRSSIAIYESNKDKDENKEDDDNEKETA